MLDKPLHTAQNNPKNLEPLTATDRNNETSDTGNERNPLCKVLGFSAPIDCPSASGPSALATLLHFHQIGWSHLPKNPNGSPENDSFVKEVMRWSETPDHADQALDTSPQAMITALNRAALQGDWFANGSDEDTLNFIRLELLQGRPVIVLLDPSQLAQKAQAQWQVVFQMDAHSVYTKTPAQPDHTQQWSKGDFCKSLNNNIADCNRTLITVYK